MHSAVDPDAPAPPRLPIGLLLLGLGVHIPLALEMNDSRLVATAHAALTVIVAIGVVAGSKSPTTFLKVAAYVVGAEVLWRQTNAVVPWEISKYVLILLFLGALVRFVGRPQKAGTIYLFLGALLPACAVPLVRLGPFPAIEPISFNIGGLLALGVGVLFLSQMAAPWWAIRPVLWCLAAPVIASATLATTATQQLDASDFINESSFAAAGGFGPNQVSAILGLGAMCLLIIALKERGLVRPVLASVLAMWLLAQGGLTFSRGGVANVAVALVCALPLLLRYRNTAARVLALFLVLGLLSVVVIYPRLDEFTGGALQTRFSNNHEADERAALARKEYSTFLDNVAFGAGVGESARIELDRKAFESHTEYTRLLAEHGLPGLIVIGCLLAMFIQAFRRQKIPWGRTWTVAFAVWALFDMSHAATRIAAPAFAFALATLTLIASSDDDEPAVIPR